MDTTTPEFLISEGYTEDKVAQKRFENAWLAPTLLPATGFIGVLAFALSGHITLAAFLYLAPALLALTGFCLYLKHRSKPKSRHTGKPLEKFRNQAPEWPVSDEFIYICTESKTFFTSVITEDPGNIPPKTKPKQ